MKQQNILSVHMTSIGKENRSVNAYLIKNSKGEGGAGGGGGGERETDRQTDREDTGQSHRVREKGGGAGRGLGGGGGLVIEIGGLDAHPPNSTAWVFVVKSVVMN